MVINYYFVITHSENTVEKPYTTTTHTGMLFMSS